MLSGLGLRRAWLWSRIVATHFLLVLGAAMLVATLIALLADARIVQSTDVPSSDSGLVEAHSVADTRALIDRATAVHAYARKYRISDELSGSIYDLAREEGLDPALAYRLVQVESRFSPDARSTQGAIGYTQLRLPTARGYDPDLTAQDLLDRETNLRLGFRYLRELAVRYQGDMYLALLAYNRGPTLVDSIRASGGDPANGYAGLVLRGVSSVVLTAPARTSGS
jgi:soluble lytic murein transglycosylase-like protein